MVEKVVNVKVVDNVEATTKNVANLKTQLRQAQNEVNELSEKFGATSEQAVKAAKRAAELKDAIGDAKALTDAFNPDAKFKALTSTLGGVAGGFAAVQGAVGLLGSESQNVEKAILKVQSAMAISQGIQSVGESIDSFKQLGATIKDTAIFQKALAAATAIQTFVMNGATLAAKAFRGALVATGIGALVVGIGLLIENFDKLKSIIFGGASNAEILNKKLKETISLNDELVSQNERSLKLLEAQGANEEKIFATRQQNLNREINLILGKMDAIDEVYKAELKAGDMTNERKKELEDQYNDFKKQALEKRTEFEINQNAKVVKDVNSALDEQIKREDEIQASKDKKEKIAKEKREKAAQKAKEDREKELAETNDFIYKISQAEIEQRILEKEQSDERVIEIENEFAKIEQREIVSGELNKELADKEIERQKAVSDAKIDLAKNTLNLVAEIAGEGSDIAKGVAVAQATISGIEGVQNSFTTASKSPITTLFPAYPFIQAGLAGAFSALQIKKIISTPKSGGGGSTGGSVGSAQAPPQFNIVGQSGTNQLAQTIAGKQNQPIEAFVVSSAVTNSQSLDRNRVKTATFGG